MGKKKKVCLKNLSRLISAAQVTDVGPWTPVGLESVLMTIL